MSIDKVQAVINSQTYNLSFNAESQMWEAEITAPSKSSYNINDGHYYPITIKAQNNAGTESSVNDLDPDVGEDLRLKVIEKTKPVISITSPTDDQRTTNNKPQIIWNVTDDDSGVNPDSVSITINNGQKITSGISNQKITGGYKFTYTPEIELPDGTNTVKCDASDYDKNEAVQRSVTFIVDTKSPELSVTYPTNNLVTNKNQLTITGTASDTTSPPVKVTVKINNEQENSVSVGETGNFSTTVELSNGVNTIVVKATDSAGKTSSIERTVTLSTNAPVISEVVIPDSVDTGQIFKISARVTD